MVSLLYILLAIAGLSFLVFIHELGHYWMARRVGMKVETFAIGFGRPIVSWVRDDGVKWQIGWLPFGGYVRIKGQDIDKDSDPYSVPDGFFGKSPWDRIKVAFMGPFVNILFALAAFALLWLAGGREKSFSEFSDRIGWVDPASDLYSKGVRPGDQVISYNGSKFQGAKDHVYAALTGSSELAVEGNKINYRTGESTPFQYSVRLYPSAFDKGITTAGILAPAGYVIYDRLPNGKDNALPEGSPLKDSGIQYGDRIFWVDGETIFSQMHLSQVLNDGRALLTINRDGKILLRRVPRVLVKELKLDTEVKEELIDWQFEAKLNSIKAQNLYYIPYNLNNEAVVEKDVHYIDKEKEMEAFRYPYGEVEDSLKAGDRIIAVDGTPIERSYQLLAQLQTRKVNIIVQSLPSESKAEDWRKAQVEFDANVDWKALDRISSSIGTAHRIHSVGNFRLLNPVTPKAQADFEVSSEKQAKFANDLQERRREIEKIEDPELRQRTLNQFEHREKQLLLGLGVQDKKILYNPGPFEMFSSVFKEIWRTLTALVTGSLNPKWISGPIGIVQVVHDTSMVSLRESLFWLGAISLNLAILNLLPIPVLDGGTILLSAIEGITRRKIHPKTLEKIVIPFAILLIAFFIFLTYNDLSRIFGGFWRW